MAHKPLIDGTAYEISGGKTLVNGTAYSIKNGKTLVGGTAYEVGFGGFKPLLELGTITLTLQQFLGCYQYNTTASALPDNMDLANAVMIDGEIIPLPYDTSGTFDGVAQYYLYSHESCNLFPKTDGEISFFLNAGTLQVVFRTKNVSGPCDVTIGIMK